MLHKTGNREIYKHQKYQYHTRLVIGKLHTGCCDHALDMLFIGQSSQSYNCIRIPVICTNKTVYEFYFMKNSNVQIR